MRIVDRDGSELVTTDLPEDQLRLRDVQPGQVFKYLRGKDHNIYLMGQDHETFLMSVGRVYYEVPSSGTLMAPVIIFPLALMNLGDPAATRADYTKVTGKTITPKADPIHSGPTGSWDEEDEQGIVTEGPFGY